MGGWGVGGWGLGVGGWGLGVLGSDLADENASAVSRYLPPQRLKGFRVINTSAAAYCLMTATVAGLW